VEIIDSDVVIARRQGRPDGLGPPRWPGGITSSPHDIIWPWSARCICTRITHRKFKIMPIPTWSIIGESYLVAKPTRVVTELWRLPIVGQRRMDCSSPATLPFETDPLEPFAIFVHVTSGLAFGELRGMDSSLLTRVTANIGNATCESRNGRCTWVSG
jgi:hypothetical protein